MKFLVVLSTMLVGALAVQQPLKQYMVSYTQDTPPSVLEEAKNSILEAGGKIVHEFDLLTGFIADATSEIMDKVHTLDANHQPTIEQDSEVKTQVV